MPAPGSSTDRQAAKKGHLALDFKTKVFKQKPCVRRQRHAIFKDYKTELSGRGPRLNSIGRASGRLRFSTSSRSEADLPGAHRSSPFAIAPGFSVASQAAQPM